jgi:uncharacterized membrane protein YeiH
MLPSLVAALDWFGLVVFAVTGALVASRKQMDLFGFALLGTVTGLGGGTVRDILLGQLPAFWVQAPAYVVVCVSVSALVFFFAHIPESRYRVLLWLDAVGLALFAATGAEKALNAGADAMIAVCMGVITATFGGIMRDVLGGEVPLILRRDIYVTAALLGAGVFVGVLALGLPRDGALALGFVSAFALRASGLIFGWSLPAYKARPGRMDNDTDAP